MIPDLEDAGIEVYRISAREVVAAAGMFYDGIAGRDVTARDVRHLGEGPLTTAAAAASKRELEKSWAWGRRSFIDASPLVVVSNALYGYALKGPGDYDVLDSVR